MKTNLNPLKALLITSILVSTLVGGNALAANHWSPFFKIKSLNVWSAGVYLWPVQSGAINPGSCTKGGAYVIAPTHPAYEALLKTALTAAAADISVRAVVADSASRCIGGHPIIEALNLTP